MLYALYLLIGAVLASASWQIARDASHPRRRTSAVFWGLLAFAFIAGDFVPREAIGVLVIALALIAGFGGVGRGVAHVDSVRRRASATRLGHRLFVPALLIPAITVVALFALKAAVQEGKPMFDPQHATLLALALACLIALGVACRITSSGLTPALQASRGLLEAIGWAALLPLALAMLGGVFAAAGVGQLIAELVGAVIPVDNRLACVLAYALGMAGFTMIMGNAFAAFPVMTAGIALPLLVGQHGAEPASLAAIGMLSGYCGTLMTPMAANFNIVPAALLELSDQYGVIKAQIATGVCLLATNVVLMYVIAFR